MEETDASELHARRLRAKELLTPLHFSVRRRNTVNLWWRTTSENIHLFPGTVRNEAKNKKFFQGNSDAPSHLQEDSARDDEEVKK